MPRDPKTLLRKFHQAKWDEALICDLHVPGERGVIVPPAEEDIDSDVGDCLQALPEDLRRTRAPRLPEVNQVRVLRHFTRLSQETLGMDVTIDISQATCTMKYSPKVQEHIARTHPGLTELHPLQPEDTLQGILEIYHEVERFLKEISGMDGFSLQPGGGAQAIFANACIMRAFHAERGEHGRNEIITTMFSHPANAAAPATAGYKVITLMPDENGYPDLEALKAALSERTAGLFITNPEDTGIFNPRIEEYVNAVHAVGGLCSYDQANANGLLGITRARDAGFDMCHFNLHKTFSAPHGCMGPALGANGVTAALAKYLPVPVVGFDGRTYRLDYDRPHTIGRVRSFFGNAPVVMKTYAWIMQHGEEGLKEVAGCAVLNSNYLEKMVRGIPGVDVWYAEGKRRLEQVRYSWDTLKKDTGVGTEEFKLRMVDYGLQPHWTSHHPFVVPEPFTLEPCESYSKDDIDEYAAILRKISNEAYEDSDFIKNGPYNSTIHHIPAPNIDEPERIAVTWRQLGKKGLK